MNKVGYRFIFDQDGDILGKFDEYVGEVEPRKPLTEVHFIDLEHGAIDNSRYVVNKIDVQNMAPILEEIEIIETEEQKRIKELEDALLLQTENEIGGIL